MLMNIKILNLKLVVVIIIGVVLGVGVLSLY